ncbi:MULTISPECIES: PAS domain S-box protein [Pseudomonadaceae]|jgi:PAS domain S-box-containing protein|uniref:PAS domain-containing protein n=1 Tax=Aquipseudomonas alcaligenes TaxID=43263 RepID=A0AA42N457_AQUAC|nr:MULTISPECIES: PAS domain-containing protein [Pseudomonas]MDH1055776.1 PAS domain-containing protein [Pseudomonas alcaligenes]NMY43619.1 PAS domain S-box protein [Pseudomonas sp. WS 5013]
MRAAELIDLLRQYDPDTDIPVAYTDADFGGQPGVQVASCYSTGDTRCYQNLVEQAQEGLVVLDPRGRITYMNPFMQQFLGYPPAEALGRPLAQVISADLVEVVLKQRCQGPTAERYPMRIQACDGQVRWVQMSAAPIPSIDGSDRGSLLTITDISHREAHAHKLADQESLGQKVWRISEQLDSLKSLRVNLLAEFEVLQDSPRIAATPYWHQQRYLYLVRPQKDGKRVREYIGAQPERINEALAAVRREQRYQEVCRELQDIEEKIRTSTFKLDSFLWELARVPQDQRKLVG